MVLNIPCWSTGLGAISASCHREVLQMSNQGSSGLWVALKQISGLCCQEVHGVLKTFWRLIWAAAVRLEVLIGATGITEVLE